VAAGCIEDYALLDVGELVLDAPPCRVPSAASAVLAAAAMLAHWRVDGATVAALYG
jgi:hypothetical protein